MSDDEPILDPAKIAQLRALDYDDMPNTSKEIARAFLSATPSDFDRLREAVGRSDPKVVGDVGHKIKGSALEFGGTVVARLAGAVELAGEAGDGSPAEVEALGKALDTMYAALREAFDV